MPVTSGTRLGTYEIGHPIGAGGMGEVYRARDRTLQRDVAMKLLPDIFAVDPDRVMRFQREAQTLAALNHLNIAHIYGVIEKPPALVMELVEGQDLSARLAAGPIPIEEALPIARQVAEALEAAHDLGIVHRDLKPGNIKLGDDGSVKVLDFGLAKALDTRFADGTWRNPAGSENSPTFTSPALTVMGIILGTAAYMAPEQAKGKAVDKRADIWAFGVVLYEMLAGRPLFACETPSETIAAVIRADLDVRALPRETPHAVRRLIARCLERDAKLRLRDIGEARILLSTAASGEAGPDRPARLRPARAAAWAVGGALAGGLLVWLLPSRPGTGPATGPAEVVLQRLTELPGAELHPDISPDGRHVVYSRGSMNIWRVEIDQRTGAALASPQAITSSLTGVAYARFAGDQRRMSLMAYSRSFELSLAPIDVGAEVRVRPAAVVRSPSLGWCSPAPQGDWLACTGRSGNEDIYLMRPDGSETIRLMDDAPKDRNPTWSPDGDRIGFMSTRTGEWELWSVRRDGSDLRQMTDVRSDIFEAVWAPDGRRAATTASTRPPFGTWMFDLASIATRQSATFVKKSLPETFSAESWSPDGTLIAGSVLDSAGAPRAAAVLDVATGRARVIEVPGPRYQFGSAVSGWLPDSRRFLFRVRDEPSAGRCESRHMDASAGAAVWRQPLPAHRQRTVAADGALGSRC